MLHRFQIAAYMRLGSHPANDRARIVRWLDTLAGAVASGSRAEADRVFADAIPSFAKLLKDRSVGVVVDLQAARSLGGERGAGLDGEGGMGLAGGVRT